jgi:hypothetical protein
MVVSALSAESGKQARGHNTSRHVNELRRGRLEARLQELQQSLDFQTEVQGKPATPWPGFARKSLMAAKDALDRKVLQEAWTHCHQAFRFLLHGAKPEELQQWVKALRREAGEKLKNWRKRAVEEILDGERANPPGLPEIVLAQYLLDQHFENVYFKLEMLAIRARRLPYVLGSLAVAVLLVSAVLNGSGESSIVLYSFTHTGVVMLLGAIGASLSNALSALNAKSRIPQIIQGWQERAIRLLIGALSAVIVVLIVQSGILPIIKAPDLSMIYAYAIVAGFTDQLLSRAIRAVEKSIEE